MKRCKVCVLPETFPGVRFNAEGICNFCSSYTGVETQEQKKLKYRKKFEALIEKTKGKTALMCSCFLEKSTTSMCWLWHSTMVFFLTKRWRTFEISAGRSGWITSYSNQVFRWCRRYSLRVQKETSLRIAHWHGRAPSVTHAYRLWSLVRWDLL